MANGGSTASSLSLLATTNANTVAAARPTSHMFMLLTLGINDTHPALPAEATWKAAYAKVLDDVHTVMPAAQILVAIPWGRDRDANCNTLATWIADVLTTRAAWASVGIDERTLIENGDNGVTYTYDGIHPNAAGIAVLAPAWQAAMGY